MNKIVFLLPVSVMFLLFYFGYQYINSSEQATNVSLQNEINIALEANRLGETVKLKGKWDWTQMPADGLIGDDYIMITVKSADETPIDSKSYLQAELYLIKGDELLQSIVGEIVEDGIVFTFPNTIIDHESYGNRGEVEVVLQLDDEDQYSASFSYVHTWIDHELGRFTSLYGLKTSISDSLTNHYWSVIRYIQF